MLVEEAKWLLEEARRIGPAALSPLLDVGSSDSGFRQTLQPHIGRFFAAFEAEGGRVLHVDRREADGVDLVGDLMDPRFLASLQKVSARAVLAANLLEHVEDRPRTCRALGSLLPDGGRLLVTVPRVYPYHEDPIDNGWRPRPAAVVREFPGFALERSEIVAGIRFYRQMIAHHHPVAGAARTLGAPGGLGKVVRKAGSYLTHLPRRMQVTAVILRREARASA